MKRIIIDINLEDAMSIIKQLSFYSTLYRLGCPTCYFTCNTVYNCYYIIIIIIIIHCYAMYIV